MEVTYDPAKDAENIRKHRISLERAEDFDEDTALYDPDDSQDYGEERWNLIGWIDAKLPTLTVTYRPDKKIRASLRKSTTQEHRDYADEY